MVREIISLGIGQCGIQTQYQVWRQYNAEHRIDNEGLFKKWRKIGPSKILDTEDKSFHCLYQETDASPNQFVPRNLFVDLEPNVIDDIKTSPYSKMYSNEFLLAGKEDAANNFARGHYTVGKGMIDKVNDRLRKLVENCENLQGFIFNHSVGGGTGSGLGCLMLERMAVDYRKKPIVGFHIYPSPSISTCVVEPYNALLSTHWLCDHTDVSLIMDNAAIYKILQRNLDIVRPSFDSINRLISKPISSMTAGLRFEGELNVDLNELRTNLVPFPRLHFLLNAYSPITTTQKMLTTRTDVRSITERCFSSENFFVSIPDWDVEEDKYMSLSVHYRGNITGREANDAMQWVRTNRKVTWWGWSGGYKCGLNDEPTAVLEDDNMAYCKKDLAIFANNSAISRVLTHDICKKYDLMFSQRAFVHWYIGEGMEEGEFAEAREDLGFLEKDYLDAISEQATDDEEDWTDEDEDC